MKEKFDIDQLFEASLGGMTQEPSASAWDGIAQQLGDLDYSSTSEVDKLFDDSLSGMKMTPSKGSWSSIENQLNSQGLASVSKIGGLSKFGVWIAAACSVAALVFYFSSQFDSQDEQLSKKNSPFTEQSFESPEKNQSFTENTVSKTDKNATIHIGDTKNTAESEPNNQNSTEVVATLTPASSEEQNIQSTEASAENQYLDSTPTNAQEVAEVTNNPNISVPVILDSPNNNELAEKNISTTDLKTENTTEIAERTNANYLHNEENINSEEVIEEVAEELAEETNNQADSSSSNSPASVYSPSPARASSVKASTGFSLDLFAGPEFISSPNLRELSEEQELIQQEYLPYSTDFSLGFNLKYHYNRFFIQSGLTYANFGERATYLNSLERYDTTGGFYTYEINTYYTYDTVGWFDDPLQEGVVVPKLKANRHTDTISETWNSVRNIYYDEETEKSVNRYRYIEIPLMVGYHLDHKNWSFSLATGVSYGFKVAEQGKYINQNQLSSITGASSPYFDSNINGIISFGVGYAINTRISAFLQPTFKTNISHFSESSSKYQSLTLRLGLNIKL